jgi:hypothetical protein
MRPRLISGWPKRALSEAMRMSQDIESSQPPPRQKPLIIAMTGFGNEAMTSKMRGLRMAKRWSNGDRPANSPISAPAMNDFSPEPVMTTAPTPSSVSISARAARSSTRTSSFSALSLSGRLIVRMATRPSRAESTVWDMVLLVGFSGSPEAPGWLAAPVRV